MKLGDTIFNGNQFKNVILNSVSYKRLILGVNLVWSYFSIAIKSFRIRILADSGTYEAESILEDRLQEITPNLFDSASLVITTNGVKTSKLYSIKPNDGTGDLSVTRATTATRVDENGNIVNVPANVARIDYSTGQPAILVEPQRTNLVYPSDIATTQVRAVTAVVHTLSFYGTGSVVLSGAYGGTLNGTGSNNRVSLTFTPTAGNLTLTVSGSVTNWQLEAGRNATSLIKTISGSVTRNADVISNVNAIDLIGQTEGTIFVDYNKILANDGTRNIISINDGSTTNLIEIWDGISSGNLGRIIYTYFANNVIKVSGIGQQTISPSGRYKICLTYLITPSLVNFKFFINGVKLDDRNLTYNAFSSPLSRINIGNRNGTSVGHGGHDLDFILKTRITDGQAIQLTTL
jgi:hypothetical protein